MLDKIQSDLLTYEDRHKSLFPESDDVNRQIDINDLWLEQPAAQKIVNSTTSGTSAELPVNIEVDFD